MITVFVLWYCLCNIADKIERYVCAISMWTLCCFGITEILSVKSAISTKNLWISWILIDVVLLFLLLMRYFKNKDIIERKGRIFQIRKRDLIKVLWGVFALGMLGTAIKMVPYNYDSMTYHMSRVFHWLRNGSVAHYASSINRQIASPVLGEFVNLHVYAMSGGRDWFVNLMQCGSYLTNGIFIYYLAKKLTCSKPYCMMASVLYYSLPIALAEAFSTQVDNYAALWMLGFVYLILDLLETKENTEISWRNAFRISVLGLCVAFGYLTKPSVGVAMAFFALWLLICVIRRKDNIVSLGLYLLLGSCVLLVIVAPEIYRNIVTFGSISAPVAGQRQLIGTLHPKYVLVNFVKNFTFNMPTVWIYGSTELLWKAVLIFADILNVELNHPAISEDGRGFKVHAAQTYGQDTAVSPIIIYLLIGCIVCFFITNRKKYLTGIKNKYFVVTAFSFLVFCAVLRWEPYVGRYMISYFAILCPAIAGQVEILLEGKTVKKHTYKAGFKTLFYFLCITEMLGVLYVHGKYALLYTRPQGYFGGTMSEEVYYAEITDAANSEEYSRIGLMLGYNTREYPFLMMLNEDKEIKHVNVTNETSRYEEQTFIPDAIITMDVDLSEAEVECHGYQYEVVKVSGDEDKIYLLKKKEKE